MTNIPFNDHLRKILLLKYLFDYDGINGETNLQKFIFLLQEFLIVWFGYEFIMYFHGPFSRLLKSDIDELHKAGFIIKESLGNKIRLKVNENIINKDFFNEYDDFLKSVQTNSLLEFKIRELLEYGLHTKPRIELAASIIQIINNLNTHLETGICRILNIWKPEFSNEVIKEVLDILFSYKIISMNGENNNFTYFI